MSINYDKGFHSNSQITGAQIKSYATCCFAHFADCSKIQMFILVIPFIRYFQAKYLSGQNNKTMVLWNEDFDTARNHKSEKAALVCSAK